MLMKLKCKKAVGESAQILSCGATDCLILMVSIVL